MDAYMFTYVIYVCIRARACCVISMCVWLQKSSHFMFYWCIYVYMYYSCMHSCACMLRDMCVCVCLHECSYVMFDWCIYVYTYYSCIHSCTGVLRNVYVSMVTWMFRWYVLLVYLCMHRLFVYAIVHVLKSAHAVEQENAVIGQCVIFSLSI